MFDISLSTTSSNFDVELSYISTGRTYVKISSLFSLYPILIKIGGVFVEKTLLVKTGGIFN